MDMVVGGREGQLLYVLDNYNGVFVMEVDGRKVELNKKLGLIEIEGGYRMDQYMDESLLVLVESTGVVKTYSVVDFSIDVYKGIWFKLNEYFFTGRAKDVDIGN